MMKKIRTLGLFLLIIVGQSALGQTNKEIAMSKNEKAVELMDNGKIDESIKLLEEAQALDPEEFSHPYELAYAHYIKEDFKGAIELLEKLIDNKDTPDLLYQLLGNSYDMLGQSEKAFEVYDAGIKKFPNSGRLYLEKGNVYWNKQEYDKALSFYEKGIEIDLGFPSNYYRATLAYCNSSEEVWGMIYGEIFMNLEPDTKRTDEISKLLYDTYKNKIKIVSDTSLSVSFSKNLIVKNTPTKNIKLPFGIGVYEPVLMASIAKTDEKSIDLNSLDRIRQNFLEIYFKNGNDKKYPNILFDFQNKVLKAGHMEAYNHWILMKGDEAGFDKWYSSNKNKWNAFVKWNGDNGLEVDNLNKFFREQY